MVARGSGGPVFGLLVLGTWCSQTGKLRATETVGDRARIDPSVVALLEQHRAVELAHAWGCARFAFTTAKLARRTPRCTALPQPQNDHG